MPRPRCAFTLVELVVVVAVISLLAAFVIPVLLTRLHGPEPSAGDPPGPVDAAPESTHARDLPGILPEVDLAHIDVSLAARHQRQGIRWETRYRALVSGELQVRVPVDGGEPVRLSVPFPQGVEDVEELVLTLEPGNGSGFAIAENVEVDRRRFQWSGSLSELGDATTVTARYTFTALGAGRFELRLPSARRLHRVEATAQVHGLPILPEPAGGLVPREQTARNLGWNFQNLVSERPLVVAFATEGDPLQRALLLFKLAGVAVLLFGAGFWYLGEVHRPGRLDSFRWGHFLLLALTYSFFFAVFGVLSYRGVAPTASIPIAALAALPLLALHVATIFDGRFALTRTLPLALWTIAVVAGGVYGGEYRAYLFLGLTFLAVTWLTLTFRTLLDQRAHRRSWLEEQLADTMVDLEGPATVAATACDQARQILEQPDPKDLEPIRARTRECLESLEEGLRSREDLRLQYKDMQRLTSAARRQSARESLAQQADELQSVFLYRTAPLRAALDELDRQRNRSRQHLAERPQAEQHCLTCGSVAGTSRYCPGCGKPTPRRLECQRCNEVLQVPTNLLRDEARTRKLHCMGCGEPHPPVQGSAA